MDNFYVESIPFTFITVFLLLYSREFLNTKHNFPLLHKLILVAVFARIALFIVGYSFQINFLHHSLIDNFLLLPSVIGGILVYQKGEKHIRFYLISFAILFIGFILHSTFEGVFYRLDFMKNSVGFYFDEYGMIFFIFIVIEVLCFTFSLTERILNLRKNREWDQHQTIQLQKEIIEHVKENFSIKEQYSLHLEEIVALRTNEIKEANMKLLEQALHINKLLKEDNDKLNLDLEVLHKVRVMKTNVDFDEFVGTFDNEATCLSLLSELKWKQGYQCRKCKFNKFTKTNVPYERKCKLCKYEESATANTLLNNIKFPIQKALYLVYAGYSFKDLNVHKLSEVLELRTATCYGFMKKIKETMANQKHTKFENLNWTNILI